MIKYVKLNMTELCTLEGERDEENRNLLGEKKFMMNKELSNQIFCTTNMFVMPLTEPLL